MLELRDYQTDVLGDLRVALREHRSVILQLPTGAGKTAVAGAVAEGLSRHGQSQLAITHRHELVDQFCRTLDRVGLAGRYGVIASGRAESPWAKLQVASVQTLHRRRHLDLRPDLVVVDEVHHARALTWNDVLSRFPTARLLGLTATPERLDGKPLGRPNGGGNEGSVYFDHLVEGPSIHWLVAHGYLAPVSLKFAGRGILTAGARTTAGDYNRGDLGKRLNRKSIVAPVDAFMKHARDRRAIFFGVNTQDSQAVADLFCTRGIRAAHIDGKTNRRRRDQVSDEFKSGHLQVVCNVALFDEGYDVPMCDCVLMGMPTLSLTRYLQQAGRAMRPEHGRDALILDLVGNIWRHGFPEEKRHWDLHGDEPEKKKTSGRVSMRVCVHCANVYPSARGACPECGEAQPMEIPKHLDMELLTRDGDDEAIAPKPQSTMAKVRQELRRIVREQGGRAEIEALAAAHGMSERWKRTALEIIGY